MRGTARMPAIESLQRGDHRGVVAEPTAAEHPAAALEPTGEDVVPFSFGTMEPPKPISRAKIEYTREALAAHVTGLLVARCTITREGDVENCKIIKGLPHMNEAVLQTLETWRYTPVQYQGKPISVTYTFNVKLDLPR